jgi:ribonuclease HII
MGTDKTKLICGGVDEAGLGPTLGPLVVASFATVSPHPDLRALLKDAVCEPGERGSRIEVGDSKKIHTGARKLARIERTVLATICWTHGSLPGSVAELLSLVRVPTPDPEHDLIAPWFSNFDEPLPVAADLASVVAAGELLSATARAASVEAAHYRADIISAHRINRELAFEDRHDGGSKNTWATHAVLKRVVDLHGEHPEKPCRIQCDKAGGRSAYTLPLRRALPGHSIHTIEETRECSRYDLEQPAVGGRSPQPIEVAFLMRGDQIDPRISWASCLAKYCRELMMRSFNRYWRARIADLAPTAGYPEDARRFIAEVEDHAEALGFARDEWVRSK